MKRQALFPVLTAVLFVLVLFVGIEVYVRLVADNGMQFDLEMWKYGRDVKRVSQDPLIGHEHRPNRDAVLMGVDVRTNSDGFRAARDYSYDKPAGTLRVMMLGDSLTEGWGVPFDQTFPQRIERKYAEKGIRAEVIDAGVGNYNTIQEVEAFLTRQYRYGPDIVVLNFFVRGAEPVPHDRPPSLLMRLCYSCIYFAGRVDTALRMLGVDKDWVAHYLGLFDDGSAKGWIDAKEYIKKLADYCHANGVKLLVVSLPELHDVKHYRFQFITHLLHKAADENHAAFVDILPYLQDQDSPKLWVSPEDTHPNAFANELMAQGEFEALQKLH